MIELSFDQDTEREVHACPEHGGVGPCDWLRRGLACIAVVPQAPPFKACARTHMHTAPAP